MQQLLLMIIVVAITDICLSLYFKGPFLHELLILCSTTILTAEMFKYGSNPYSLHKIVNIFLLLFFVLANTIQYLNNNIVSSISINLNDGDYQQFQFVVLLIAILFNSLYYLHYKMFGKDYCVYKTGVKINDKLSVLISLASLIIVLLYYRNDPISLVLRGLEDSAYEEIQNPIASLLFTKIIRALPFSCFIICLNYDASGRAKVLTFMAMLIALFPTSISRNAVAMYWLPVLLILVPFLTRRNIFVLTMLIGLFVIFPIIDIFRYWGSEFSYSLDFLNSMHFDSSQEMMIAIKKGAISWGKQLLGVFLFFVPRSVWPDKPVGSGSYLASQDDAFENISMPFWGEGYVNFGFVGVLIFTIFLSWFCAKMDVTYWKWLYEKSRFKPYYFVLLGALLFVLRGDLLSGFSYTIATLFDIYLVERFVIKRWEIIKIK